MENTPRLIQKHEEGVKIKNDTRIDDILACAAAGGPAQP
jgi:hypothetical protein